MLEDRIREIAYYLYLQDTSRSEIENWLMAEKAIKPRYGLMEIYR